MTDRAGRQTSQLPPTSGDNPDVGSSLTLRVPSRMAPAALSGSRLHITPVTICLPFPCAAPSFLFALWYWCQVNNLPCHPDLSLCFWATQGRSWRTLDFSSFSMSEKLIFFFLIAFNTASWGWGHQQLFLFPTISFPQGLRLLHGTSQRNRTL